MFIDQYQYEKPQPRAFDCKDGEHIVKIKNAEVKYSKAGQQMIVLTLAVKDSNNMPYVDYFVDNSLFNEKVSRIFDSFDIDTGDFNFENWLDKFGKAVFGHKEETYTNTRGEEKTVNKAYLVNYIPLEKKKLNDAQAEAVKELSKPIPKFSALETLDPSKEFELY